MCKKITRMAFSDTPLAMNEWADGEEVISGEVIGDVIVHRSGDWSFEYISGNEACQVYAAYKGGNPVNFCEYQGESIDYVKIRRRVEDALRKTDDKAIILEMARRLNVKIN